MRLHYFLAGRKALKRLRPFIEPPHSENWVLLRSFPWQPLFYLSFTSSEPFAYPPPILRCLTPPYQPLFHSCLARRLETQFGTTVYRSSFCCVAAARSRENRKRAEYSFGEDGFKHQAQWVFLALTELQGENSVRSTQPIICVQKRTHEVFPQNSPSLLQNSVSSVFRSSTLETILRLFPRKRRGAEVHGLRPRRPATESQKLPNQKIGENRQQQKKKIPFCSQLSFFWPLSLPLFWILSVFYPKDPAVLKELWDSELLCRSVLTTPPKFTTPWTLKMKENKPSKIVSVQGRLP